MDVRRDGSLVAAPARWTWGAAARCGRAGQQRRRRRRRGSPDNENAVVDGGNDVAELTPLAIERSSAGAGRGRPSSWRSATRPRCASWTAPPGAPRSSGPRPAPPPFADVSPQRIELGMEGPATRRGFDGEVTLTLRATHPGQPLETKTHRADGAVGDPQPPRPGRDGVRRRRRPVQRPLPRRPAPAGHRRRAARSSRSPSGDVWVQDCMEFGYASVPASRCARCSGAAEPAAHTAPRALLAADRATPSRGRCVRLTFDSGGNLEASPPVTCRRQAVPVRPDLLRPGTRGRAHRPAWSASSW